MHVYGKHFTSSLARAKRRSHYKHFIFQHILARFNKGVVEVDIQNLAPLNSKTNPGHFEKDYTDYLPKSYSHILYHWVPYTIYTDDFSHE